MEIPLLVMSLFSLSLIYGILLFTNLFRLCRLSQFQSDSHIAKKFYVFLLVIEFIRTLTFVIASIMYKLGITEEQMETIRGALTGSHTDNMDLMPKPLFIFTILPDYLFILAFLILFWQLLSIYNKGHANLFKTFGQGLGKWLILATGIMLSSLQLMMLLLYMYSCISAKAFSIECTILNFISATFVWVSLLIFANWFSGSPYKSAIYKMQINKLTLVIGVWVLSRYCRGIWGAFEERWFSYVFHSLTDEKNDALAAPMLFIVLFVIVEVIPILIVQDWSFMEIFILKGERWTYSTMMIQNNSDVNKSLVSMDVEQQKQMQQIALVEYNYPQTVKNAEILIDGKPKSNTIGRRLSPQIVLSDTESQEQFLKKYPTSQFKGKSIFSPADSVNGSLNLTQKRELMLLQQQLVVDKKDFQIGAQFEQQRPHGLGTLYEAKLKDHPMICREIKFTRVKEYVVDDFIREFASIQLLGIKPLLPITGIHFDHKTLTLSIFMQQEVSLFKYLHSNKTPLTSQNKKNIAMSIANALRDIHAHQKLPIHDGDQAPITHRHLSSHNIMIKCENLLYNDFQIYIADLGSEQLNKYAKLFMNYQNTNAWSPPELLQKEELPTLQQQNQIIKRLQRTNTDGTRQDEFCAIDTYSYGILLWELETMQIPFEGLDEKGLRGLVIDQNLRPQIPEHTPESLRFLIRYCWQKNAFKRPSFEFICKHLNKVDFS